MRRAAFALVLGMTNTLILIKDLAKEVGIHRTNLYNELKRRSDEFPLVSVRHPSAGNQKTWALTRETADAYIASRRRSGFADGHIRQHIPDHGFVYVLQPDPEARPNIVKIGWSTSFEERLNNYRTIAPWLVVRGLWTAARQGYEGVALDIAERHGERVGMELFRIADVATLLRSLDQLFALIGETNKATSNQSHMGCLDLAKRSESSHRSRCGRPALDGDDPGE